MLSVSQTKQEGEEESCKYCETPIGEDGQEHFCGDCGEEINSTQCEEWLGNCCGCAWKIKR